MLNNNKKYRIPHLIRLNPTESQAIASMFRLYDYKATGRIPPHLAKKLICSLGFEADYISFTTDVSLADVLYILDKIVPDPSEPILESSLKVFNGLVAVPAEEVENENSNNHNENKKKVIRPNEISEFMVSLGRPPASLNEAKLLLNSMLPYDDCSAEAAIATDTFSKELINFAKKNNLIRDIR
eukprot:gene10866-14584_t